MNEILVLTTVDATELAGTIARELVESRLAACVNIVPGVRSIYRWQGSVCDEAELLLIIKSAREHFEKVRAKVRALHSYELPEIIAVDITHGDAAYLDWMRAQVAEPRS